MKLREKIKSYSFWVSLSSAVILILKVLGSRFGFAIDETMVSDLFTAMCSILVILGIIVVPQYPQQSDKQSYREYQNNTLQNATTNNINDNVNEVEKEPFEENILIEDTTINETEQETIPVEPTQETVLFESDVNDLPIKEAIITNTNVEINNSEINEENINNQVQFNESENLINLLKAEKDKYSSNLNEFIKILQHEINITNTDKEA